MPTATLGISLSIGGVSIQQNVIRTAEHPNPYQVSLAPGKSVSAWVKTDANTAACNLPAEHGYANGDFDVYWEEAGVQKLRYGVPGTISTNALSLDGGSGDDFPASATEDIVVCRQTEILTAIDGDNMEIFGVCAEYPQTVSANRAHADFQDEGSEPTSVFPIELAANAPFIADIRGGAPNPLTGDPIAATYVSNGSSTDTCILKIISLDDVTP